MPGFFVRIDEATLEESSAQVARRWWVYALVGVLAVVVGGYLMVSPEIGVVLLAALLGLALVVSGIAELATMRHWSDRAAPLLLGLVSVAAGVTVWVWPGVTMTVLALAIGLGFLLRGIIRLAGALSARPYLWGTLAFVGALEAAVGIAAMAWPGLTLTVLGVLVGLNLVVTGMVEVFVAGQLRRLDVVEHGHDHASAAVN